MVNLDAPSTLLAATLQAFNTNTIEILINNAGLGQNTLSEYDKLMIVNVRSVIFMTQATLKRINCGGGIVKFSSISTRGGYATNPVYAATKAAVEVFTTVWATKLGHKHGITVSAVNPGLVDADMYRAAGKVHLKRME